MFDIGAKSKKVPKTSVLKRMRTTLHGFYFWLEKHEGVFVRDQRGNKLYRAGLSIWRHSQLVISG